ncbi:hypothetical protein NECAME_04173 [Necator americanus]|uniref:Amino acid transporter transmembrane domain-containing protein n=1 Tax=Necator americanus TaxID=51031 RepID=W2SZ48_NECAM|nr:hypothetical protein NECAME_04173 [Necator americanus]ETN73952.1 hypothetical protein NECAME_04173 [Necator americanus]
MVNLVKAMTGVGAFAVPVAFQQAGLWMGIILAILLGGFVNAHSFVKLVRCSQYLSKKRVALNYGDMAGEAFATRKSKYLKKLAKPMKCELFHIN